MRSIGRFTPIAGCVALLVFHAHATLAQQGSVQVTSAVQTIQGDAARFAGQNAFEPDVGVSWLQPGSRFGVFQIEIRGARRGDSLHTGRMYGALRDLKWRSARWAIEAGDAYVSPSIAGYGFSNLFSPAVTFNGATVNGRSDRSTLTVVAGKTTAWRNIFGNDPKALGQSLGIVHSTHRFGRRLEVGARGSRVRTSSLDEFSYTIDASDQAGGGARFLLTSSVQLVADASLVSYRRTGTTTPERDGSYLAGLNWLHSRGYVQVNASRFSPGDFPALNNPLQDREQLFAVGEYDLMPRTRVSGGWERFRTNLKPEDSLASTRPTPETSGDRGFGAVRVQVTSRSTIGFRGEEGTRDSRPVGPGFPSDSDTGTWAAEWQAAIGSTNAFVRYSGRQNVEHLNQSGSYDQRDASAQLFANLRGGSQAFGTAILTRTTSVNGGGNTYWQTGGGTQLRLGSRDLWLRAEANAARNMDLLTRLYVPRESFVFGVNGQMSRWTTIAFNVNMDRAVTLSTAGSPWLTRSIVRITHTLPTGSVFLPGTVTAAGSEASRGTGAISGLVFADWNSNGVQDSGENPLEGIPLTLGAGHTSSRRDGQFAFLNVPAGLRSVGLDTSALPVDFDPPPIAHLQIELSRGDTQRVSFGLVPLGMIHGRVVRDANGNGKADANEEAIDGAIVVLDGGVRSEQARKGRYRFDAVRSGQHLVRLLIESLPDGAAITGDAEMPATLSRDAMAAEVTFVVSVEKRPEIRKVFPPRGGAGAASVAPRAAAGRSNRSTEVAATARNIAVPAGSATVAASGPTTGTDRFAIQIAALNDPLRAKDTVQKLKATGMPAYLVSPPPSAPDAPYRVRLGPYNSREEAQKVAATLEAQRGEKLWVTREK
jgi:cell division septation protein DedD